MNRLSTAGRSPGPFPISNGAQQGSRWGRTAMRGLTGFSNNTIGRVTPNGWSRTPIPTLQQPRGIGAGPDGNVVYRPQRTESAGSPQRRDHRIPHPTANKAARTTSPPVRTGIRVHRERGEQDRTDHTRRHLHRVPLPTANSSPARSRPTAIGSLRFVRTGARIGKITSGVRSTDRRPALNGTGQAGLPLVCGATSGEPRRP